MRSDRRLCSPGNSLARHESASGFYCSEGVKVVAVIVVVVVVKGRGEGDDDDAAAGASARERRGNEKRRLAFQNPGA